MGLSFGRQRWPLLFHSGALDCAAFPAGELGAGSRNGCDSSSSDICCMAVSDVSGSEKSEETEKSKLLLARSVCSTLSMGKTH